MIIETLKWFPEGAVHKKMRKQLGEDLSNDQDIGDETPKEISDELRLMLGKHLSGARSTKPQVTILLADNDEKQTKPTSATVRWLRGDERQNSWTMTKSLKTCRCTWTLWPTLVSHCASKVFLSYRKHELTVDQCTHQVYSCLAYNLSSVRVIA